MNVTQDSFRRDKMQFAFHTAGGFLHNSNKSSSSLQELFAIFKPFHLVNAPVRKADCLHVDHFSNGSHLFGPVHLLDPGD